MRLLVGYNPVPRLVEFIGGITLKGRKIKENRDDSKTIA
jgi:hypothetical protein